MLEYYDNGELKARYFLVDSLYDSVYTSYYHNGKIHYYIEYEQGRKNGMCSIYYDNGRLNYIAHYKNGLQDSTAVTYFPNGNVKFLKNYLGGKLSGSYYQYSDSGKISVYLFFFPPDSVMYYSKYNDEKQLIYSGGNAITVQSDFSSTYTLGDTFAYNITVADVPYVNKIGLKSFIINNKVANEDTLKSKSFLVIMKKLDEFGDYRFRVNYFFTDSQTMYTEKVQVADYKFFVRENTKNN